MATKPPYYPKVINLRMLRYRHACNDEVKIFRELFPNGCTVSRQSIIEAERGGLLLNWAIHNFLSKRNVDQLIDMLRPIDDKFSDELSTIEREFDRAWVRAGNAFPPTITVDPASPDAHQQVIDFRANNRIQLEEQCSKDLSVKWDQWSLARANAVADFLQLP